MNYDYKNLPPFKWFILENFPFIEYDFDALTNWQLFCKLGKEMNKIIENLNLTGEQVENLTNAFNSLQNYVNNYFDNLDIQSEIDAKLDEMAESGQLADIIADYIQLKGVLAYDTVADMKEATNLVNGSFVQTYGFYSVGDKGEAKYKVRTITNDDVIDEMTIIELADDYLIAELVDDKNLNIKKLGAYGDDEHYEDIYINTMITKYGKLKIPEGIYKIQNSIDISNIHVEIEGRIHYVGNDFAFIINNATYKNYNFATIVADNGGLIKMQPLSAQQNIIYCNFKIKNGDAKYQNLFLDASYNSISLCKFYCDRLRSSESECINLNINSSNTTYISEINFIGTDIKAGTFKAIKSISTGSASNIIQYRLTNCDLEDSSGIYAKDYVNSIILENCRLFEIALKQNWLTLENRLPDIFIIGDGQLYPKNIQLINITQTKNFLFTTLPILVNSGGYYYYGGFINKDFIGKSDFVNRINKSITDTELTDSHYFELPSGYNEDVYNMFSLNVSAWVQITVPNKINYNEFIFRCQSNVAVTFVCSNGNTVFNPMETGYYKMFIINGRIKYLKLSE